MNKKLPVTALIAFGLLVFSAQAKMIVFAKADKNKDGVVSKEEYFAENKIVNPDASQKQVEEWFKAKDIDNSGTLTPEELKSNPKKLVG